MPTTASWPSANFAIGEPEHQTVADGVQCVSPAQLGHTVSVSGTELGKARGRRTADEIKGGVSGRDEIGVEKPDLVRYPLPGKETKGFAVPTGGVIEPSRSLGRKEGSLPPPVIPGVTKVAATPVSIFALSKAKAWGPRKVVPAVLNMFMAM